MRVEFSLQKTGSARSVSSALFMLQARRSGWTAGCSLDCFSNPLLLLRKNYPLTVGGGAADEGNDNGKGSRAVDDGSTKCVFIRMLV